MDTEIKKLQKQLQKNSDKKTKDWFNNYLKGAVEYRGIKTPKVTKLLSSWVSDYDLLSLSLKEQLNICDKLMNEPFAEDKFAGIIFIQKYLLKSTEPDKIIKFLDKCFQNGYLYDWSTTDWCCVRVIDPLIVANGMKIAKDISLWRESENIWQRRASIVSLRGVSKDQSYHSLIKKIISILVKEDERFIQTGIGWTLA